jgi:hypothetical protein
MSGTPKIRHRVYPAISSRKSYAKRISITCSREKREIIARIKEKGARVADLAELKNMGFSLELSTAT